MAIPFSFKDWQTESVKSTRFNEDRFSVSFGAFRRSDSQVIFTLGGLSAREVSASLPVCVPKSLTFTDPLSAPWSVVSQETTGIYSGATYNLDTSGGFWRTTIGWGNGVTGLSALIEWGSTLSYTPTSLSEIIKIKYSVEMRKVSSTTFLDVYAFPLTIRQGINYAEIVNNCGANTDWQVFENELILPFPTILSPINFGAYRYNTNKAGDFSPNSAVIDIRNLNIEVEVSCA
jgi:hypothetical protein